MVKAEHVLKLIQNIPADDRSMKFLISLANNAFDYGQLTERQEAAFMKIVSSHRETLIEKGVL